MLWSIVKTKPATLNIKLKKFILWLPLVSVPVIYNAKTVTPPLATDAGNAHHWPKGPDSFVSTHKIFVTASGVHAPPPLRGPRLPMGNPRSATAYRSKVHIPPYTARLIALHAPMLRIAAE